MMRLNDINVDDIVSYEFFNTNKLSYDYFIDIYCNEIKNHYLKTKINLNKDLSKNTIKSVYEDYPIAEYFINLIYFIKKSIDNNVLLVYFKNSNKILFFVKSFDLDIKQSPHCYYIVSLNSKNVKSLNKNFQENENLMIIYYSN